MEPFCFLLFNHLSQRRSGLVGGGVGENKASLCVLKGGGAGVAVVVSHQLKIIIQKN